MGFKSGILFLTLVAGSLAVPAVIPVRSNDGYHTDTSGRIVGGTEAAPGSAPYMVALTLGGIWKELICGASLISTRTVLTAAHCVDGVFFWGSLSNSLLGNMGSNVHPESFSYDGISFTFSRNVTHRSWDRSLFKNDIGLLITTSDVRLSATVQIVPLSFEEIPGGVDVRVAAWGRIQHQGQSPSSLQELTMKTIEGEQCRNLMPQTNEVVVDPQLELCTLHSPGFGTCTGDSGSALVEVATGKQVGIVSWGIPCGTAAPDAFVRVSAYQDWLLEHIV